MFYNNLYTIKIKCLWNIFKITHTKNKRITFNLSGSISLANSSLLISAIVFGPSLFDEKLAKPCSPSKSVNASPSNLGLGAKERN